MQPIEFIRESVVIKVDFVRAGCARSKRPRHVSAEVVDLNEARRARGMGERQQPMPIRLRLPQRPGHFGGPF
jgi:hypothetical protein